MKTSEQKERSPSSMKESMDESSHQNQMVQKHHYVSLKSKAFIKILLFQILWMICFVQGITVIPSVGAQWFGGCVVQDFPKLELVEYCDPDYVTFNFYFTLFSSIGGVLSFLFAAFIGRLTDTFGRKIFIIFGILSLMIPRVIFIFYINLFLYWSLTLFADINGGDQFLPALKVSISDIISPEHRIYAFGALHGASGIGLIIGSISAIIVSYFWNNYAVILTNGFCYLILLICAMIFLKETIDINHNRISISKKIWRNPFKSLTIVCRNKFMLYLSSISFFATIVEAGILGSLFGYVGHSLKLTDEASMVYGIYIIIAAVVVIPVSVCFLPFLKKRNIHYTHIIVIAVCFRIVSLILLILISIDLTLISGEYILYCSAVLHGFGMFSFAVLESVVSEYVTKECQGIAFGVITSYKGIAAIIGPFSFGVLFTELSDTNASYLFVIVGILMCGVEIVLCLIPLKRLLNKIKPQSVQVGFENHLLQINTEESEEHEHEEFELSIDNPLVVLKHKKSASLTIQLSL